MIRFLISGGFFNNFINYTMLIQASRPPQILTGSIIDEPSFSYLNLAKNNSTKATQRNHIKVPSGIERTSRSKDKSAFRRQTIYSGRSRSASTKKWKNTSRSKSKNIKTEVRLSEKAIPHSKKQSKFLRLKQIEPKLKTNKSEKFIHAKKNSLESLFKKQQQIIIRKKKNEEKGQKKIKPKKSKDMRKTRTLKKTQSQSAMDQIPLSQIQKVKQSRLRDQRVIQQYFGHDDHLASILQLKQDKFKRSKTKIDKLKTRSSASSTSRRKLSKFGKPTKVK